jgi:steroid 5-alpha reductase family enzyme
VSAIALFAAGGLLLQLILWAVQRRSRNAATADAGWAILVGAGAIGAAVAGDGDITRRVLVAALAGVWSLRRAGYLIRDRVMARAPEDGRYRALRERWGAGATRNFLMLYLAQVPIATLFVIPLVAAMRGGAVDAWATLGVAVWLSAVAGEWIADRQLQRFRADVRNRGVVCREGLWRYSRHPNYFFEWLHWWSYVLIGHAQPLTFLGPAAMLLFLFRITGIPYTERQAVRSRGDAYRVYQRTTSAFIPWPPRRRPDDET